MFIDRHRKYDILKFVIDIDIKYDKKHLNINIINNISINNNRYI